MHHHRSEHWIIVKGTAKIEVDKKEIMLCENQSTYIPIGAVHRLSNWENTFDFGRSPKWYLFRRR